MRNDREWSRDMMNSKLKYKFSVRGKLTVKIYKCPISEAKVDAIVNTVAHRENLVQGSRVSRDIACAAGDGYEKECMRAIESLGSISVAETCVTTAGRMQTKAVIHAAGPCWFDYPENEKKTCLHDLRNTVVNILRTAVDRNYKSVAMTPMSYGTNFNVPDDICAGMYINSITKFCRDHQDLGSLKEFHIIGLEDKILDLVIVAYRRRKTNKRFVDTTELLKRYNNPVSADKNTNSVPNRQEQQNNSRRGLTDKCIICCDRVINATLNTCGHLCMCYECAITAMRTTHKCPVCRQEIRSVIKTFIS